MPAGLYIDLDKGQLQQKKENYPFPLPAVLVKFGAIRWSSASEGLRLGDLTFTFTLIDNLVTDSFEGAESENETIELLDLQDDLFQALEEFSTTDMQPLTRESEGETKTDIRAIIFTSTYKTTIQQTKEIVRRTVTKPKLVVQ